MSNATAAAPTRAQPAATAFRAPRPILLLALVFLLGVFAARLPATISSLRPGGGFVDPIQDVLRYLVADYVDPLDSDRIRKLQTGAVNGMLEALDDPYAEYVPAARHDQFMKELSGEFVGIGAQISKDPLDPLVARSGPAADQDVQAATPPEGAAPSPSPSGAGEGRGAYLTIISPMEDSPALAAGLRPADRITHINGESTLPLNVDECIDRITGKPGTTVRLTVERPGLEPDAPTTRFDLEIERARISVHAVKGARRLSPSEGAGAGAAADGNGGAKGGWDYLLDHDQRIAYLRLSEFIPGAPLEVRNAVNGLLDKGPLGGLILDLRSNPGGDLDACLEIADLFLKSGDILTVKGRRNDSHTFTAEDDGTFPDFPMLVLVNGASASASEILAGALSERGRAVVLGTRTFGKGLVQTVRPLPSDPDAVVKFTQERYYLPSGRLLHRNDDSTEWGVDPTPGFFLPVSESELVDQFLRRTELDLINTPAAAGAATSGPERWSDPQWLTDSLKDKQLARALTAMRDRLASGAWKPLSDAVSQAAAVHLSELRVLERAYDRLLREVERVEKRLSSLESTVETGNAAPAEGDLWPDQTRIQSGRLEVFDADGHPVTTLKITNPNIERWLMDAGVEPVPAGSH